MTLPIELQNFPNFQSLLKNSADDSLLQHSLMNMAIWDPDEDDDTEEDDFEETYGDLEDGHDDLTEPESDRGVDNLE